MPTSTSKAPVTNRLLLIGSNKGQLEDLRSQLIQHGYEAVVVEPEALIRTSEEPKTAAIVADLRSGEMDMVPLVASVRRLPLPLGNVPFMALLSKSEASEVARHQAAGVTAVMTEPFAIESVIETLHSWEPMVSPDHSYLDGFALTALVQNYGRENFAALLGGFFEEARGQVALINQATDTREIERLAHTVKSTARMFGAHALFEAAKDLEHASPEAASPEHLFARIETVSELLQLTERSSADHGLLSHT
ncbi:Hpt domain-containing protein [Azospirillum sp. SYSU D00513]|uniref:Hpt domain-containing response regulator n=1 Tax=Azospirillum sp. SYSU D00513 TaxID=2812561 RepID=UPI001A964038|nr:Hpt domain-containing protein [Azospirillum sp. SYSU D00513]